MTWYTDSDASSYIGNIFGYLDTERPCRIDDDTFDPGNDEPKLSTQCELNNLVRHMDFPKELAEDCDSREKEEHFLAPGTSISWSSTVRR